MAYAKLVSMMAIFLICGALAASGAAAQSVLFDAGHGEPFLIGERGPLHLSGLAETFRASGAEVAVLRQPISDASLSAADGLVISGAFTALRPEEIEAVVRFMQRGGKLAVMLHIAPPLATLLDRLQISHTNGVIQESRNLIGEEPRNFRAAGQGSHPVLQGVREFSLYGAWGLMSRNDGTRVVAATGPQAWIDVDRNRIRKEASTGSFGVVVAGELGKGGFLVFGDDAIFQNKFLDRDNKTLAANLAGWLK